LKICATVLRSISRQSRDLHSKNGIELGKTAYACRDCGLTWGLVDPGELGKFIDRHCDERESK